MALNEASSIVLGTSHYLLGGGRRVLKDLGCVTIELDLIPLRLCNILMTPLIAR